MAIAIKTKDNTLVVIDAITSLREDYSASVTNSSIEDGSSISDSVLINNESFTVDGVITSVGFLKKAGLAPFQESSSNLVDGVSIDNNKQSSLFKVLPSSVKNLVSQKKYPLIDVADNPSLSAGQVKNQLISIFKAGNLVTVQDTDNLNKELKDFKTDCVITSISFSEDTSSDALNISISFEKVKLVKLKKTKIGSIEWKSENITTQDRVSNGVADSVQFGKQTPNTDKKYTDAELATAASKCYGYGNGATWELTSLACIVFGKEVPVNELLKGD